MVAYENCLQNLINIISSELKLICIHVIYSVMECEIRKSSRLVVERKIAVLISLLPLLQSSQHTPFQPQTGYKRIFSRIHQWNSIQERVEYYCQLLHRIARDGQIYLPSPSQQVHEKENQRVSKHVVFPSCSLTHKMLCNSNL